MDHAGTDGRTPDRCLEPAPRTMRAVPVTRRGVRGHGVGRLSERAPARSGRRCGSTGSCRESSCRCCSASLADRARRSSPCRSTSRTSSSACRLRPRYPRRRRSAGGRAAAATARPPGRRGSVAAAAGRGGAAAAAGWSASLALTSPCNTRQNKHPTLPKLTTNHATNRYNF